LKFRRTTSACDESKQSACDTHFEAEFIVILVECDVHQSTTETVVGKDQENVLQNLVNVSQILTTPQHMLNNEMTRKERSGGKVRSSMTG